MLLSEANKRLASKCVTSYSCTNIRLRETFLVYNFEGIPSDIIQMNQTRMNFRRNKETNSSTESQIRIVYIFFHEKSKATEFSGCYWDHTYCELMEVSVLMLLYNLHIILDKEIKAYYCFSWIICAKLSISFYRDGNGWLHLRLLWGFLVPFKALLNNTLLHLPTDWCSVHGMWKVSYGARR
jgi:hypothetical protein